MDFIVFLCIVVLFYLLTPGVTLYLPPNASLPVAALTHGIVFSIILTILYRYFVALSGRFHIGGGGPGNMHSMHGH
jgi:hypothetical protein